MLHRPDAVDLVVRRHDSPRRRFLDRSLKRQEVYFPERLRVHLGVDGHAVGLLVVAHVVLERRADPFALHPLDPGGRHLPRQDRILREVLEVATAQRAPLEVGPRAQEHLDIERQTLLAQRLADLPDETRIPRRGQCGRGGKAGRRGGVRQA